MAGLVVSASVCASAAAQTWSTPQFAANGSNADAVATNGHGASAIVTTGATVVVQSGGVWGAPVTLNSATNLEANVAVAPNGDVLAVWSFRTSNSYMPIEAQAAFYTKGKWASPITLSSNVYGNVSSRGLPAIAFDGASNATLIWEAVTSSSPIACALKAATGSAASGLSGAQTISTASTCFGWTRLAINAHAEAVAVQGVPGILSGAVVAISRNANGVWSAPTSVGIAGVYRQRQPKVGLANDGSAVLLWLTNASVRYSVRSNNVWSSPATLPVLVGGAGGAADLAVDGAGDAVALFTQTGIGAGGYSTYRAAGGSWQPKLPLPSGSDLNVVASAGGSFVIGGQTVSTRLGGSSVWNSTSFASAANTLVATGDTQAMAVLEGTASAQLLTSTATVP
jgi:hypothetical protein